MKFIRLNEIVLEDFGAKWGGGDKNKNKLEDKLETFNS